MRPCARRGYPDRRTGDAAAAASRRRCRRLGMLLPPRRAEGTPPAPGDIPRVAVGVPRQGQRDATTRQGEGTIWEVSQSGGRVCAAGGPGMAYHGLRELDASVHLCQSHQQLQIPNLLVFWPQCQSVHGIQQGPVHVTICRIGSEAVLKGEEEKRRWDTRSRQAEHILTYPRCTS